MTKIITDSPKHHKYVTVNKKERKKIKIIANKYPLLEHWAKCLKNLYGICVYLHNYGDAFISGMHYKVGYRELKQGYRPYYSFSYSYKYQQSSHIIVWNDCNHKTCRIIRKNKLHNTSKFIGTRSFPCYPYTTKIFTRQELQIN